MSDCVSSSTVSLNASDGKERKWKYKNEEEEKLAKYLIDLEEKALKKYFNGDMSGYKELWSKTNFSYFDANCD